jgi:hypothetical protein
MYINMPHVAITAVMSKAGAFTNFSVKKRLFVERLQEETSLLMDEGIATLQQP